MEPGVSQHAADLHAIRDQPVPRTATDLGQAAAVNLAMVQRGLGLVAAAVFLMAACSREVPSDRPVSAAPAPSIVVTPTSPTPTLDSAASFVPLPTAPTMSSESGGELLIACDGPPFSTSLFDQPADAESNPHPAAAYFRSMDVESVGMYAPVTEGWWMMPDTPTQVWFLARFSDEWFVYYRVDFGAEGWTSNRSGECTLTPASPRQDLSDATWELDPEGAPLDASSTTVDVLVTERVCTGGATLADRLLRPAVIYGPESVMVIVGATLDGGPVECPADLDVPLRVMLREPLGDRTVRGWVPPPDCCG